MTQLKPGIDYTTLLTHIFKQPVQFTTTALFFAALHRGSLSGSIYGTFLTFGLIAGYTCAKVKIEKLKTRTDLIEATYVNHFLDQLVTDIHNAEMRNNPSLFDHAKVALMLPFMIKFSSFMLALLHLELDNYQPQIQNFMLLLSIYTGLKFAVSSKVDELNQSNLLLEQIETSEILSVYTRLTSAQTTELFQRIQKQPKINGVQHTGFLPKNIEAKLDRLIPKKDLLQFTIFSSIINKKGPNRPAIPRDMLIEIGKFMQLGNDDDGQPNIRNIIEHAQERGLNL
jgi:hypothetical protein|tara:strand:- start:388 stop:1239 length:852 start_codon:yes stop_codon:yes gene_type:complete